jgi:hypothetical protein
VSPYCPLLRPRANRPIACIQCQLTAYLAAWSTADLAAVATITEAALEPVRPFTGPGLRE